MKSSLRHKDRRNHLRRSGVGQIPDSYNQMWTRDRHPIANDVIVTDNAIVIVPVTVAFYTVVAVSFAGVIYVVIITIVRVLVVYQF